MKIYNASASTQRHLHVTDVAFANIALWPVHHWLLK